MKPTRAPTIIPDGWRLVSGSEAAYMGEAIWREDVTGLRALFSLEQHENTCREGVDACWGCYAGPGRYRHMSISRPDRYPDWDEMIAFIRRSGLFDLDHEVQQVLPPLRDHHNLHPNCFHWWQKVADGEARA